MDLDMLKAVVVAAETEDDDHRAAMAGEAVDAVLDLLRRYREHSIPSEEIYDAIKSAYVGSADWGDDEEIRQREGLNRIAAATRDPDVRDALASVASVGIQVKDLRWLADQWKDFKANQASGHRDL